MSILVYLFLRLYFNYNISPFPFFPPNLPVRPSLLPQSQGLSFHQLLERMHSYVTARMHLYVHLHPQVRPCKST